MSSNSSSPSNAALTPVQAGERVFSGMHLASLWFSLGVGLLVMQVGAYLMPALSPQQAMLAIVGGSIVGAGLLAWVGKLGCDTGLSSAGLIHHVYGRHFAKLPVLLNIVQLLGWGAFELVVMRDSTVAIGRQAGSMQSDYWPWAATLLWGGLLMALMLGSMVHLVRRLISRIALPLVVLSLLWLTWQFTHMASVQGFSALWSRPGAGGMGVMPALDLVVAMPISWLPLVSDYSRYGKSGRSAMAGTWLGFGIANVWCYALGVLVALVLPSKDLVAALLLAQGGLIALSLVLLDEVDNAYGDAYSGAVSAHSVLPAWSVRAWGLVVAAACTLLALVLPMHSLEPFLLLLSSVFVPLFGVILGRLSFGGYQRAAVQAPIHWLPVCIWLCGIALYHALAAWAPVAGSAIPTLVVTFVVAFATRAKG
ncbi:putative hydroxymethylpyrimidine transporter CytX [Comamonas odontotermitis]|uniref:Hydroxymethylpyrimidine transporter CytX n=1 Tax=Comamonas odontotermitis TaxID=379895 RepID=A0ABR6RJP2_9BURK|nr:cytosine permease [Comamonas odontotermitis]MBB6579302.1 putative hydroxymethylpyrimidine transporter CytX [Comamonas odontotermitis]